ncbi:MAG TPA: hypothetical protein VGM37_16560 [Armatimonadota bacterium]|jgi:hypothetical protein
MEQRNGYLTPRQMALVIAVFFIALGLCARFLTKEAHPLYSMGSFGLAAMWMGLAWTSKNTRR